MTGSADEDALTFRAGQVAALRGLLAQRTAELDEARSRLDALRASLAAAQQELVSGAAQDATAPAPLPRRRRWRDRIS